MPTRIFLFCALFGLLACGGNEPAKPVAENLPKQKEPLSQNVENISTPDSTNLTEANPNQTETAKEEPKPTSTRTNEQEIPTHRKKTTSTNENPKEEAMTKNDGTVHEFDLALLGMMGDQKQEVRVGDFVHVSYESHPSVGVGASYEQEGDNVLKFQEKTKKYDKPQDNDGPSTSGGDGGWGTFIFKVVGTGTEKLIVSKKFRGDVEYTKTVEITAK